MVGKANILWLRRRDSRYIGGTPKGQWRCLERELTQGEWGEVRDGLEVKTHLDTEGHETFILCRCEDRTAK